MTQAHLNAIAGIIALVLCSGPVLLLLAFVASTLPPRPDD